ncbi:TRAF3-interacting protein 1-like isoform X2 [Watersipora subatra]|uniref:TRAF3-interacting protein 1-like isoform X2 n=1 Tax=Watersipora subatra TaxID=2589382 RepID=UPI00355BA2DF
MNEDIVKRTQDSLGKLIGKKPPLTEKLLNRPPFRFLHDILTSVIRQTGFMKGLFTEKESSSESITTKEEKVAFLQKAIDITVLVTGAKLSVRPSKVVAGLEAEKTNEFLQTLAVAIEKKPDNDSCVKKILGGGDADSSRSRESKSKDSKEKDREQSADRRKKRDKTEKTSAKSSASKKDKENRENSDKKERDKDRADRKERDKEGTDRKDRDKDSRRHRDSSKDGRRESSRHRESSRDRKEKESSDKADRREERRERSGKGQRKKEEEPAQVNRDMNEENESEKTSKPARGDDVGDDAHAAEEETHTNRIPRPSSAKGSRRRHREDDAGSSEPRTMQTGNQEESIVPPQVEQSRRLARPNSARPAPPRVKRQDGMQDSLTERVDSARTQRVENVIIDNAAHSEEEDDDNFMVEEGTQDTLVPEREETMAPPSEEDGQHGGLVKKILESRKEYAQSEQQPSQTKTKIDKSSVNDVTRHKEKEMVRKEVDKLRNSIQALTRSANPLGKIMDYVQEDLHSMQKERDMWRAENSKLTMQIKEEMGVTDGSIEPLKVTLAELDQAVADQLDLIAAVKHSIIDNDDKITKMISSVSRA